MDYEKYWHSSSHVMAAAVKRLWPEVKLGIGPAIENGFYYDFYGKTFSKDDLKKIEKEMRKICAEKHKFTRSTRTMEQAKKMLKDNKFKLELLNSLEGEISFYSSGEFSDLCRGPHIDNTGEIKEIRLLKTAAAYWKGDEKNDIMQRIYGITFKTKKEMDDYLHMVEEAEKRDHRKIGAQMDLFGFKELIGQGFAVFYPKGFIIRQEIVNLIRGFNDEMGFQEVWTPHTAKIDLWKTSGHYEKFRKKMYLFKSDKTEMGIKPMNCPFHIQIYNNTLRSYKELPIRYSEFGTVYRKEQSGELRGLLRVITITQDDRHSFLMEEQAEDEIEMLLKYAKKLYKIVGMKAVFNLSTRPEVRIGSDEMWEKGESILKNTLKKNKIDYVLKEGEGAFYGPKIDIDSYDALGRKWQLTTIQLDFFMPERFNMEYISESGKKRTVMIHCALVGALERFIGVITEHFAGKFPVWLSPVQVLIMPITEKQNKYAKEVLNQMKDSGIRAEINDSSNTLQYKIRDAQENLKVPYMVILGEKEEKAKKISVRDRSNKTEYNVPAKKFIEEVSDKIKNRTLN